jgi:PAS domain S-box-containing protein
MKRVIRFLLISAICIVFFIFLSLVIIKITDNDMRNTLLRETRKVAGAIDSELIQKLEANDDDLISPFYYKLKGQLSTIYESSDRIRFIYLMGRHDDGSVFFYADSEKIGSEDESPPGQIFYEASPELKNAFISRQSFVEGPLTDRWGSWISSSVPIIDSETDSLIAILGMDVDADMWQSELMYKSALPISLLFIVFIMIISFIIALSFNRALSANRKRFRDIIDSTSDLIIVHDVKGRLTEVNNEACIKLGYKKSELLQMNISDIDCHMEKSQRDSIWQSVLSGKRLNIESVLTPKDGKRFPVEIHISRLDLGREIFALKVIQDITKRKESEDALRKSHEYIEMVMDNLPLGIAVNTVNPVRFEYMNNNFLKIYRVSREAISGDNDFWEAVYEDKDFRQSIKKQVEEGCESKDPKKMVWENIPIERKGKDTFFISAMNTPIPGTEFLISSVWDVTERKKMAEESKKRLRELEIFYKSSIGREERILELKKIINELEEKLKANGLNNA